MPKKRKISVCQAKKYDWKKRYKNDTIQTPEETNEFHDHCYNLPYELEEIETVQPEEHCYTIQNEIGKTECDETTDVVMPIPVSDLTVEVETMPSALQVLFVDLKQNDFLNRNFAINISDNTIQILEMYNSSPDRTSVKLSVTIDLEYNVAVYVHRKEVSKTHPIWDGLPHAFPSVDSVEILMRRLSAYSVCFGNPDVDFHSMTPVGCEINNGTTGETVAYRDEDFCAIKENETYSSSIRSVQCSLLVEGSRCRPCSDLRKILYKRWKREEERSKNAKERNFVHSRTTHKVMTRENLLTKISQQRGEIKSLSSEVERLRKLCEKEIQTKGVQLNLDDCEMKDFMASCREDVEKSFPDKDCFQRLFWQQQLKYANLGGNGMRWHPMIIRWCLYIRSKSAKAYDAMRDTGFIKLPSARTLFDYSHYTKSALGFQPDIIKALHEEAAKQGMLEDGTFKAYTGIVFDEIKIKEDLVYDKHTGELIGYCNLDDVGNQILELEKNAKKSSSELAKSMLVVMVRGVATSLKFPLAGFATDNITADFLYPILWKTVSILEADIGLKVLFFTCDGASANRKFFQLHKLPGHDGAVYFTPNPHDSTRNIYFISDVPHLLKTARNCFSNSNSHKKTRQMWKDGKDISWMHIVRLYEEHCEQDLYTPCPKLTRSHIDLTAFSYMKVNLAAQILSGTVANALEEFYGSEVSETIQFVRNFNKFFDCLNVRSLLEGRNKRNADLNPFRDVNDPRLHWLREDFLGYIREWELSVENRAANISSSQKAAMQLSHQTKSGLEITIKSVTECIKFMLENGAEFVLSHNFNQDPLEQYFGHFRHKGGANNNPTVYDVRNTMTQLLSYRTQALGPRRGNISYSSDENVPPRVIDSTKIPKRKR